MPLSASYPLLLVLCPASLRVLPPPECGVSLADVTQEGVSVVVPAKHVESVEERSFRFPQIPLSLVALAADDCHVIVHNRFVKNRVSPSRVTHPKV